MMGTISLPHAKDPGKAFPQENGGRRPLVSKTRVCIKNLPPKTTERDLKEYLLNNANGRSDNNLQITDCKILRNEKGKSRKVAFVGFRSEEQAQHAIRTFHRAFLNMTRIIVEPAVAKKDVDAGDGSTNTSSPTNTKGLDQVDKANEKNHLHDGTKHESTSKEYRQVQEFLGLMGKDGNKQKFWANDDGVNVGVAAQHDEAEAISENVDDDNHDSTSSSSSNDASEERVDHHHDSEANDREGRSDLSDIAFLRSKQTNIEDLDIGADPKVGPDEKSTEETSSSSGESSSEESERSLPKGNDVNPQLQDTRGESHHRPEDDHAFDGEEGVSQLSQNRLFIRNLPFQTTEEEVEQFFSAFGPLMECHIPVDDQRNNKGYAFVTFENPADSKRANSELNNVDFQGRLLHIMESRPPPSSDTIDDISKLTWKQRQEFSRKQDEIRTVGKSSEGWSASFVRGDAVVDNMAQRLGLRKEELLGVKDDLSSGDAAVRLALGETQIIEENRHFFNERGVDMDVLVSANASKSDESTIRRSKTAILVKNLPFDTRLEELTKLFHAGDDAVEILLPPSRTIALVEYKHSTDAKKAFRSLAYRRFKHVPIYLEWAPLESMKDPNVKETVNPSGALIEESTEATNDDPEGVNADSMSDAVTSTLYIKNLNFVTTEDSIRKVFEIEIGEVVSVRIPRKIAPSKNGTKADSRSLSMGYGFVELSSVALAQKAVKLLKGKLLDGHNVEVAISSKSTSATKNLSKLSRTGGKAPTKIMVRNVPFQATRQELLKLFGSFGQLRKVRLPKKFDGSHRGFAFVEFLTGKEATAAMSGLSRTHLYGRHLVLEWASDDSESLDNLRDKAKREAEGKPEPQNKKIRFE